jgi:hypothetical protein
VWESLAISSTNLLGGLLRSWGYSSVWYPEPEHEASQQQLHAPRLSLPLTGPRGSLGFLGQESQRAKKGSGFRCKAICFPQNDGCFWRLIRNHWTFCALWTNRLENDPVKSDCGPYKWPETGGCMYVMGEQSDWWLNMVELLNPSIRWYTHLPELE